MRALTTVVIAVGACLVATPSSALCPVECPPGQYCDLSISVDASSCVDKIQQFGSCDNGGGCVDGLECRPPENSQDTGVDTVIVMQCLGIPEPTLADCSTDALLAACHPHAAALCSGVSDNVCAEHLDQLEFLALTPAASVRENATLFAFLTCISRAAPCCMMSSDWRWWCPQASTELMQCDVAMGCEMQYDTCSVQVQTCADDVECSDTVSSLTDTARKPDATDQLFGAMDTLAACLRGHVGPGGQAGHSEPLADEAGVPPENPMASPEEEDGVPPQEDVPPEDSMAPSEEEDGMPPQEDPGPGDGTELEAESPQGASAPEGASAGQGIDPPEEDPSEEDPPEEGPESDSTDVDMVDESPHDEAPEGEGDAASSDATSVEEDPEEEVDSVFSEDDTATANEHAEPASGTSAEIGVESEVSHVRAGARQPKPSGSSTSTSVFLAAMVAIAIVVAVGVVFTRRYDYEKYKGQSWKTLNSQIYDRFSTRRTTFNYDNADEGLLL
eukprot:m.339100 g.339100  ORF g.339100 m.339100 type:complete len:502 (-) comp27810_c0_seq1:2572-4077(-)